MDTLLSLDVTETDNSKWISCFKQIQEQFLLASTAPNKEIEYYNKKSKSIATLLNKLQEVIDSKSSWLEEAISSGLSCIRLSLQEAKGCDLLSEANNIKLITKFCCCKEYNDAIKEQAAKCLVNISVHFGNTVSNNHVIQAIASQNLHLTIISSLKNKEEVGPNVKYPLIRLLMHLSFLPEINQLFKSEKLVLLLAKELKNVWTNLVFPENEDEKSDALACSVSAEILKTFYALTSHLGPLNPGGSTKPEEYEVEAFEEIIPALEKLLYSEPANDELRDAVVRVLINVPAQFTNHFNHKKMLPVLMQVLHTQAFKDEERVGMNTMASLVILTQICKEFPEARQAFKPFVFPPHFGRSPNGVDPPKELSTSDTLGGRLIKLMMSASDGVAYFGQQFLLALCNGDPKELKSICGLGPTAGLLRSMGIFGGVPANQPTAVKSKKITEQDKEKWVEKMSKIEEVTSDNSNNSNNNSSNSNNDSNNDSNNNSNNSSNQDATPPQQQQ